MKNKQKNRMKVIATTASVCILLAASTTTYAKNMFDMKDMILSESAAEADWPSKAIKPGDIISVYGVANSNESKALDEWNTFRANYDKDESLLKKVGNGPTGLDSKYDDYGVYTQQMADKLDEIVKKYNLVLHGSLDTTITTKELVQKVGTGNFLGANINIAGYMYDEGSFKVEGFSKPDSGLTIDFTLSNFKKGIFYDSYFPVGNINDYQEWDYTSSCGINVHIAMNQEKSYIFADLGDSFMTIVAETDGIYGRGEITSSALELFADSFDFSLIKSQVASSKGNNQPSKIKISTREGIIGEFQTHLSKLPEISEVYAFIKDKAKDAKKEEVTEMLRTMEAIMQQMRGGVMYEEITAPEIQDALKKADQRKIDFNQPDKLEDGKLKALVEKAKANGLIIQKRSTGYYPVLDYTRYKELSANATEDMKAYVNLQATESAKPMQAGNSLTIGWDELIKRAISAEEFLKKYESSDNANDVENLYDEYKRAALGWDGVPLFHPKTKVINADAKKAYEKSIKSNPKSKITKTLKEFLKVVSQNGNKLTKKVEKYRMTEIYGE